MPDVVRAKLAEALRGHQRNPYGQHDGWWECSCSADEPHTPEHLADVLLSLEGVAIVALPNQCAAPSDWHGDLLGAWLVLEHDEPVAAWPAKGREPRVVSMPDGEFISTKTARALAAALLAAADAAEAATDA